jgi:DNA/RNA endonuclease YhcR with UshA esterase domain
MTKDSSQYLYFRLPDAKGTQAYVRTYVTDFPTTLSMAPTAENADKAAIDALHKEHFGDKADVTGILILYNGAPYLIPMSATPFTNYEEVKLSNADKVKAEMDELKLDASFSSDATVELTAKGKYYDDVKITWKSEDTTGAATVADGKLTVKVPDKEITVKVTATVTCADVTKTKTFEIKLSKTITSIKELLAIGAAQESYTAEKYIAGGIITEIQNEKYGNIVIVDESGESILVYGTFIDGKKYGEAEGTKPVVGDYVVVVGVVGQYKGTPQMKNADITSFLAATTVKAALDAGSATESNVYTKENYMISGTVTEVQNEKYGNVVIKDAEGNSILLYGLYAQDGTRYDGMATKPVVGDTITVFGPAGNYKGTAQLKNATLIGLTKAAQ